MSEKSKVKSEKKHSDMDSFSGSYQAMITEPPENGLRHLCADYIQKGDKKILAFVDMDVEQLMLAIHSKEEVKEVILKGFEILKKAVNYGRIKLLVDHGKVWGHPSIEKLADDCRIKIIHGGLSTFGPKSTTGFLERTLVKQGRMANSLENRTKN